MNTAEKLRTRSIRNIVTGCLEWTGGRDLDGYGIVRDEGVSRRVHRVAWELANGSSIPLTRVVRHTCDNPPCIEPTHLLVGTVTDNNRDRELRGRSDDRRGDRCPTAKLTWRDVRAIRAALAGGPTSNNGRSNHVRWHLRRGVVRSGCPYCLGSGEVSYSDLAQRYGVSRKAIEKIARQITWIERAS